MKIIRIASVISFIVGLIMIYIGWNMGNGHFWGKAYVSGDYTTFKIGCLWVMGALVLFLFPYLKMINYKTKNNMKRFICKAIRVMAVFSLIIGCLLMLGGISQSITRYDGASYIYWAYIGAVCILNFFLLYGFSYVVEAACRYIEKTEDSD